MCHSSKLSLLFVVLLFVMLVACAPAATPVSPSPTPTNPPPPPTSTSAPTATIPPKPTPTPGPLSGKFDAGGVNLYLICLGQGSPTVVFEAGALSDSMTWMKVMLELRHHTRVCAYDRAGMGRSDSRTGLRTSQQIAAQLYTLLANAGVEGPYIPVGHSLGGMHMLVFANRYPSEVVGLVLVDSSHPDQADQWLAVLPTSSPDEDVSLSLLRKNLPWANPDDPSFPEPMNWDETLAQVRAVKTLGSLPLIILSASPTSEKNVREWESRAPVDLAQRMAQVWLDLQKEYAALSSDSRLILAQNSGHDIPNDEPQVVIDAIMGLVVKARQK